MKADKLFYVFELTKKRLLSFKTRPGTAILANTALKQVKELISKVKPVSVRLIMDAGGCKGSVIARMRKMEGLSFLVRGARQRNQVKQWKKFLKASTRYIPTPETRRRKFLSLTREQR